MVGSLIKAILFPKLCFGCSRPGKYICANCNKKLKIVEKDRCGYCHEASFFGLTHPSCRRESRLSGLLSIYYYDPLLKKIIKNIKYRLVTEATSDFINLIPSSTIKRLSFYKKLSKDLMIIPVPLHDKRLKKRGFNQSLELAKSLSPHMKFNISIDLVKRVKNTTPQVELKSPNDRYKNLIGAFALSSAAAQDKIKNKNFIIFDDVWTTGSTIKEICRLLKKNGANKVFALTMAR